MAAVGGEEFEDKDEDEDEDEDEKLDGGLEDGGPRAKRDGDCEDGDLLLM